MCRACDIVSVCKYHVCYGIERRQGWPAACQLTWMPLYACVYALYAFVCALYACVYALYACVCACGLKEPHALALTAKTADVQSCHAARMPHSLRHRDLDRMLRGQREAAMLALHLRFSGRSAGMLSSPQRAATVAGHPRCCAWGAPASRRGPQRTLQQRLPAA